MREPCPLIAPASLWAEVGSALRQKVRQGLSESLANDAWDQFRELPIEWCSTPRVIESWAIARQLGERTLYDAAFLSVAQDNPFGPCPFWTADRAFFI